MGFEPAAAAGKNLLTFGFHSADDLLVIEETGNVGIGTSNPSNLLDLIKLMLIIYI